MEAIASGRDQRLLLIRACVTPATLDDVMRLRALVDRLAEQLRVGARRSSRGSSTFADRTRTALAIFSVMLSPTIWIAPCSSITTSDFPTRSTILFPAQSSISCPSRRSLSRLSLAVTWTAPTMIEPFGPAVTSTVRPLLQALVREGGVDARAEASLHAFPVRSPHSERALGSELDGRCMQTRR